MEQLNSTTERGRGKHFTEKERYRLEGHLDGDLNVKEIALRLKKHPSTVYREIKRGMIERLQSNLTNVMEYRANVAQRDYSKKVTNRERSLRIGKDKELEKHIRDKIVNQKYSPDAVIGEIRCKRLVFETRICVKTLYNYIDRGIFSGISNADLWQKRKKKKRYKQVQRIALHNKGAKSIDERSVLVNNRLEYGHWEGDCVKGPRGGNPASLFTLTERLSREEIMIKISGANGDLIKQTIDNLEKKYASIFKDKFKTITFDNGSEFLDWPSIERSSLDITEKRTQVYFAHPYSSWERGSNENQNRMIRRFIPKGTNIAKIQNFEIRKIQRWMNNYPRKILGYKTANERVLELTGSRLFLS